VTDNIELVTEHTLKSSRVIPLVDARRTSALPPAPADYDRPVVLRDTRERPLRDLRISVTDRCNFRCVYCMPKDVFDASYTFLPHGDLLTFEEITRVARIAKDHGVEKIRLTGGEPLLRKNIERLIEMLAALDLDLTLTTNGSALAQKARSLRDAGLSRITVSLDSLDDATFRAMNDVDFPVAKVLAAIDAAAAAGFAPIKVNAVVKRGVNDDQIVPMARYFKGSGHILRFIEFMDVGASNGWRLDDVIPSAAVVRQIHAAFPLAPIDPNYSGEVAERWRYLDGSGEIGVISSVTQAFCATCTRARLSTEGKLYTCLFATEGHDLRTLLRGGADDAALGRALAGIWTQRRDRYSEIRTAHTAGLKKIEMAYIGG
jgi:cyclic pyranopterin phosphate synthase